MEGTDVPVARDTLFVSEPVSNAEPWAQSSVSPNTEFPGALPSDSTNVFSPKGAVTLQEAMDLGQPPANATAEVLLSSVATGQKAGDAHELQTDQISQEMFDIAKSIDGIYRILDLVTEQGSGGLGE